MPHLPARLNDARPSGVVEKAARLAQRSDLAIYRHVLEARYLAACDEADSRALADVAETALTEEMRVLDKGLALAGASPAKKELVARISAMQSDTDLRRISRRFGE